MKKSEKKNNFSLFIKRFCSQDSNSSSDMKKEISKKKFHSEQVSPLRFFFCFARKFKYSNFD